MEKVLILVKDLLGSAKWRRKRIDYGWEPLWATLPEASQACHKFIHTVNAKKGA